MTVAERTHALVVGIEQYAAADWPSLDGPASDAIRFVDWLDGLGVPASNIHLFVSPLSANTGVRPRNGATIRPATQNEIFDAITTDLAGLDAELLFVFWGGHGVADVKGERYLLYGDSTPSTTWNLNVGSLITALQTDRYRGIKRQVLIIDACANFIEHLGIRELPKRDIVHGDPRTPDNQFVLYATQPGQVAKNITAEQTGALSREVLTALREEELPPDMSAVTRQVKNAFVTLRKRGLVRQVPISMEIRYEDGDVQRWVRGRQVLDDEYSALASRLYDRTNQDATFSERFIEHFEQHSPLHAYLVYGEEMEAHRSFVLRLVRTWVDETATRIHGDEDGAVGLVESVDISNHARGLEGLKQSIRAELGKRTEVLKRAENGWALVMQSRLRAYRTVAITHLIRVERLEPAFDQFLEWYIDEFWNASGRPDGAPEIVLFLAVELLESTYRVGKLERLLGRRSVKERTIEQLASVQEKVKTPTVLLPELTELSLNDVVDWFVYYVKDVARLDDFQCREHAADVFGKAERRRDQKPRTDHIESLLTRRYAELAQSRIDT